MDRLTDIPSPLPGVLTETEFGDLFMTSLSFLRHRMASPVDPKVQESIRIQLIQEIRKRITSEFDPHEMWLFGSASHAATFDPDLVLTGGQPACGGSN